MREKKLLLVNKLAYVYCINVFGLLNLRTGLNTLMTKQDSM